MNLPFKFTLTVCNINQLKYYLNCITLLKNFSISLLGTLVVHYQEHLWFIIRNISSSLSETLVFHD